MVGSKFSRLHNDLHVSYMANMILISDKKKKLCISYTNSKAHRRATRTYIRQLCADTGCSLENLPRAIEMGGERGSGRSMLAARHHDDDDGSNDSLRRHNGSLLHIHALRL